MRNRRQLLVFLISTLIWLFSPVILATHFHCLKSGKWEITNFDHVRAVCRIPQPQRPVSAERAGQIIFRVVNASSNVSHDYRIGDLITLAPEEVLRVEVVPEEYVELWKDIDLEVILEEDEAIRSTQDLEPKQSKDAQSAILKSILKDPELLDFTRGLYRLLANLNPDRKTYVRTGTEIMLDTFARLLVGDETCSALTFDGDHLLIATNENAHEKHRILYDIDTQFIEGNQGDDSIKCEARLSIKFNDDPAHILTKIILYKGYANLRDGIQVLVPDVKNIIFNISPEEHKIPNLSFDINIKAGLQEVTMPLGMPLSLKRTTLARNVHIYINPLRNRVSAILEHFSFLIRANDPTKDVELRKQAFQAAETNRERIFRQSLAWEAATWYRYKYAKDLRDYSDSEKKKFKEQADEFVSQLNKDFLLFKKSNDITKTTTQVVTKWFSTVIKRIEEKQFYTPDFINVGDLFTKFAYRYFVDLENLENYFVESYRHNEKLATLIAQINSHEETTLPVIIDDGGGKLHAEMRVLLYFLRNHRLPSYIATSKLCCCICNLIVSQLGVKVNGRHGKIFPWLATELIEALMKHEELLQALFGGDLYRMYVAFKTQAIAIDFPSGESCTVTKAKAALMVLQLVGCLETKDLQAFGIAEKKLWTSGVSDYPDESTDSQVGSSVGDVNEKKERLRKFFSVWDNVFGYQVNVSRRLLEQARKFGFGYVNVLGDGNCFFRAVASQLELLGVQNVTYGGLRDLVVAHIIDNIAEYAPFVGANPDDFILKICQDRAWADHLEILALSRVLAVNIVIIRSDGAHPIVFRRNNSIGTLYLGYEVGRHYLSLIPDNRFGNYAILTQPYIDAAEIDNFADPPREWITLQGEQAMLMLPQQIALPPIPGTIGGAATFATFLLPW